MARKTLVVRLRGELGESVRERSRQELVSANRLVDMYLRDALRGDQMDLLQTAGLPEFHKKIPFRFIDLFAGIGGLRIGLESAGGKCVFSSEWDKYCQATYKEWFGETPVGDINQVDIGSIENHDVLAAGFPCQPFSIAGVSKKNSLGRAHGFRDKTQGTLFFRLAEIIDVKRPPVLLLENVKNLMSHDSGNTWRTIYSTLEELGYVVRAKIIDAAGWVPQHRERIFIVGFRKDLFGDNPPFEFPTPPAGPRPKLSDILEDESSVDPRYVLTPHLWTYLQQYAAKHRAKGNGFGFGMPSFDGVTRTLSARYYKDGSEILIRRGPRQRPRRLTIREAALLMGFDQYCDRIKVSDTQAYRQFGNAVVPKVAAAVAAQVVQTLWWKVLRDGLLSSDPSVDPDTRLATQLA